MLACIQELTCLAFFLLFNSAEEGTPRATGVRTRVTAWIQNNATVHSHVWDRNICIYP